MSRPVMPSAARPRAEHTGRPACARESGDDERGASAERRRHRPCSSSCTGPPGSGKSAIAAALRDRLGLPLIAKDSLKEVLGEALAIRGRSESQPLGAATFELLAHVVHELLATGVSVIAEGNFTASLGALRRHCRRHGSCRCTSPPSRRSCARACSSAAADSASGALGRGSGRRGRRGARRGRVAAAAARRRARRDRHDGVAGPRRVGPASPARATRLPRLSLVSAHRGALRGAEITPVEPDPGHAGEGSV